MSTASPDPTPLFAGGEPKHRTITLVSGQNLVRGAVLGRITASDKYTKSLSASSDGSEVARCVLAADVNASGGDVDCPAYFEGEFVSEKLDIGTGHSAATLEASFRQNNIPLYLRAAGSLG